MTLIPSTAASAVYHDALTTARGWRNLCFLVLFLILAVQLALFIVARTTDGEYIPARGAGQSEVQVPSGAEVTEEPDADAADDAELDADRDLSIRTTSVPSEDVADWLYMLLYASLWGGLVFSILLSITLGFTTLVMLNGRTVGVSREVSAFFWSLVLLLLLVPWQGILNHPGLANGPFHLPGVLYTWSELYNNGASFEEGRPDWLGWVRFIVWPVVALLILLIVHSKARRGVKEALGEDLAIMDEPLRDRPLA